MSEQKLIDGKKIAKLILDKVQTIIAEGNFSRAPGLATVLVGNDPASHIYVSNKRKKAKAVGIESFHFELDETISENDLLKKIDELNRDEKVDAILVQLPLPKHIHENKTLEAINAKKDVDGFHPINMGHLLRGEDAVNACTPKGIMHLLDAYDVKLEGMNAVVIGRSNIVGKPMALMLLQKNATVTICHSRTKNLQEICKNADLVVAAIGKAKFVTKEFLKPGAVVIDVGMNRDQNNKLCGDVDFDNVIDHVSLITKVPGGVGPMTIATLLENALQNFLRTQS